MAKKTDSPDSEKPMTKTAAVLASIAAGVDVPAEGVVYVKDHYSIDVTPQQFSIIKSQAKKKAGEAPRGRKEIHSVSRNGNATDLARKVKTLVEAYGADAVKGMAEVFSE